MKSEGKIDAIANTNAWFESLEVAVKNAIIKTSRNALHWGSALARGLLETTPAGYIYYIYNRLFQRAIVYDRNVPNNSYMVSLCIEVVWHLRTFQVCFSINIMN